MHTCVECGYACYCRGDIVGLVETEEYASMHCNGCGCHEDEFFDEPDPFDEAQR